MSAYCHRWGAPPPRVRRGSQLSTHTRWTRFSRKEGQRLIFVLKVYSERLRKKGQRTGALGTISFGAIRLAEVLVSISVKGNGRLEPSVFWLAKALNVARKSIHAWKAQLEAHGFLSWTRRYDRVETPGQKGPQLRQTSNAYVLRVPVKAIEAADRLNGGQSKPPPVVAPRLSAALDLLAVAITDEAHRKLERESPQVSEPRLTFFTPRELRMNGA